MYEVIGFPRTRAFRVMWALEEMGLDYTNQPFPPGSDEMKAVNPSGKVPALRIDGTVITDSVAIMTYLADRHGDLAPKAGSLDRALMDAKVHQINDEVDALLWAAARHSFILPEEHRVAAVKDSLKWEFARNMDRLAHQLGDQEFLMGDTFTIADILLTHCGGWAISAKFPKTENPVFADYFKRMIARDGYKAAAERRG